MYTECLGPIDQKDTEKSIRVIEQVVRQLQQGLLVAFPTETTYGIAGSVTNHRAIQQLFRVKGRKKDQALPVAVASLDQLQLLVRDFPEEAQVIAHQFLPGPLTLVLKKHPDLSSLITGGEERQTVAVRFPAHPVAHRLIKLTGCPLVLSSANASGRPSSTKASHVFEDFNGIIHSIVDGGDTQYGMESTILSLEDPTRPLLCRFGVISHYALQPFLKFPIRVHPQAFFQKNRAATHTVRLFSSWDEIKIYLQLTGNSKRLIMSIDKSPLESHNHFQLDAKNLYDGLRLADRNGYSEVLVHCSTEVKRDELLLRRLKQIASP